MKKKKEKSDRMGREGDICVGGCRKVLKKTGKEKWKERGKEIYDVFMREDGCGRKLYTARQGGKVYGCD